MAFFGLVGGQPDDHPGLTREECSRALDVAAGKTVLILEVEGACASPWDIDWSPDGHEIVDSGVLIDGQSGALLHEFEEGQVGFDPGRLGWPIRFSPA